VSFLLSFGGTMSFPKTLREVLTIYSIINSFLKQFPFLCILKTQIKKEDLASTNTRWAKQQHLWLCD